MSIKVIEMTSREVIEDIAVSLASEICDGNQIRIRGLLIEFAEEMVIIYLTR